MTNSKDTPTVSGQPQTPGADAPAKTFAKKLVLAKGEERRLRVGHLWVFSNEIDVARTPLKGLTPGEPVRLEDFKGEFLANGYANPASLIAARVVSKRPSRFLDAELIRERLADALALRSRLFAEPCYRLCFAEGDFLPGLTVDRYGDVAVAQITTAGVERLKDEVAEALRELTGIRALLWRNDAPTRSYEGLEQYVAPAFGDVPAEVELVENGARFRVSLSEGQKTGWFFDQRMNRARFAAYAPGARVLDLFSYVGSFGVNAALAGAESVLCVDASARALDFAAKNAALNGVGQTVATRQGDVFDVLDALKNEGARFDLICLDPPAFIKHKKDQAKGEQAYIKANREAMKLLADGGVLLSCSCSQPLDAEGLRTVVRKAATQRKADVQILEQGGQGPDHPVHPAMPETSYLTTLLCRVIHQGK